MANTIKELASDHPYYCHTANYYSNEAGSSHETWEDFLEEWGGADPDYNFVFRWDIKPDDEEKEDTTYRMEVFFMGQRKGVFIPVTIGLVTDNDVVSIKEYLQKKWEYMKMVWVPFVEPIK